MFTFYGELFGTLIDLSQKNWIILKVENSDFHAVDKPIFQK